MTTSAMRPDPRYPIQRALPRHQRLPAPPRTPPPRRAVHPLGTR